jgi:DNA (cytosine-5)-methyltransferase 1
MGGNKTPIIDELELFADAPSFVEEYHVHLLKGGKPYKGSAPTRLRRLTVDECLAIQTFPETYRIAGEQSAMYRQIGNAVPCKLAEAVGKAVNNMLEMF